ncbi:MAG TPA: adenylate/guanylate cyclase domain-containing protein [Pyrinomonadaceae bacterium]|jgi:adenylate cyclase|nr:adenylate/guanylate cyclase domain-containing protein [Pyrinomonadaceae bacterium]
MFAIQEVDGQKRQWELPDGRALTIGRAPDNDIRIDDLRVSRHHAVIRSISRLRAELANISNGNVVLLNTTLVNAETGERALRVGDQIRIVTTVFNVVWNDEPPLSYTDEPLSMSTSMVPAESGVTALLMTTSSQRTKDEELKELRRKAEMLAQLCEMSAALASDFDAGSILDYATGVVMRTIPADCCAALLIDQEGDDPRPASLRVRQPGSASSQQQPLISRTAVRTAIEKRVMLSSHDVLKDINLNVSQSAMMQGIRSLACAPLVGREGVYGALYIDRRDLLEIFTDVDTQLLAAVAAQAAIAVEAARARERAQREALARAAFARFMPEHIIQELVENPQKFQLGGTNKRVTALFCDVRGFAKLSHRARPETIVDLLNILFTEMAAEIFEHQGTLNKYLGDGLMALFGAPVEGATDAADAVNAAIGMQRRIKGVNAQLAAKNLPRVTLGIGINTGEATVGVIGAEQRSEYTAIGDTINIASRIEGQARPGQVLVTAATARELGDKFSLSEPWSVKVKNIDEPVQIHSIIYEDVGADTPQTTNTPQA